MLDEKKDFIKIPKQILVGFEKGITKQDYSIVKEIINNHAKNKFDSCHDISFNILKIKNSDIFSDGYLYEIQQGGEKHSYLKDIMKILEKDEYITLKTSKYITHIEKRNDDIYSYYMTEDNAIQSNFVLKDIESSNNKMSPLYNRNIGVFYFSLTLFIFSIFSLFLSALFKYIILDETDKYYNQSFNKAYPIGKIKNLNSSNTFKVRSIFFEKGVWYIQKEYKGEDGKIKTPEKQILHKEKE